VVPVRLAQLAKSLTLVAMDVLHQDLALVPNTEIEMDIHADNAQLVKL